MKDKYRSVEFTVIQDNNFFLNNSNTTVNSQINQRMYKKGHNFGAQLAPISFHDLM